MTVHAEPLTVTINEKRFHLAHGEGLGTLDAGYRALLSIFRNKPLRVLYSSLHPSIGVGIGHKWSLNSRLGKGIVKEFKGEDKEDLIRYANSINGKDKIDYFIFGHRHLGMTFKIKTGGEVIILGDWIIKGSYAEWDGRNLNLIRID